MSRTIIIIPARMEAQRFFGKPLHPILGKPMILHCWETACRADIGEVIVACGSRDIYDCVSDHGGTAVLTDPDLPSGSDRIHAALLSHDKQGLYDIIINMQGDLPHLPNGALAACRQVLDEHGEYDISSLAVLMQDSAEIHNPDIVKIIMTHAENNGMICGRAYGFSRAPVPYGDGHYYHHLGIYGFRRAALERFVGLPPSPLERREKLEQWRALEADMPMGVAIIDEVPVSVDVPTDIAKAEAYIHASR